MISRSRRRITMTAAELVAEMARAGIPAYEFAAPKGLTRYAVVTAYSGQSFYGSDGVLVEWDKVQIDICTQSPLDSIAADVKAVLAAESFVWETITPLTYDPEYEMLRSVLAVELM